jgi:hypothetical protein
MYYLNNLRIHLQRDTENIDEVLIVFECLVLVKIVLCFYSENVMISLNYTNSKRILTAVVIRKYKPKVYNHGDLR